ncbi:nitrate- and nitrite sensing domain-containing protein, partial [Rhizobium paknamense]
MYYILKRFSFRTMLSILAVVPLLAAVGLGVVISREAYLNYTALQQAVTLVRVARAGGALLHSMPAEAESTPSNRAERRKATDQDYQEVVNAYDAALKIGHEDAILSGLKKKLDEGFARMAEFRQKVDAGDADPLLPLKYLQPVSATGLDMAGRASSLISDGELSRSILGYYAFLQVNDGYLIINHVGEQYIQAGSLAHEDVKHLVRGSSLVETYGKTMNEFIGKPILADYARFWQTEDGELIRKTIQKMLEKPSHTSGPGELAMWKAAMQKRSQAFSTMLLAASDSLKVTADAKNDAAAWQLKVILGSLAVLIAFAILVSVSVLRVLSSAIRSVANRMRGLAEGDKQSAIQHLERGDEIGDMARSVEVFRQAAIRNAELEAEAEENRKRSEAERAEMQARAEAEANERLERATGALASGLRQLASGDMLCEIEEQFAPQFEALRHDFNTSVSQLRSVLVSVGVSASGVRSGSGEISHASNDLAKRTETQAASLEETA